MLKREGGTHTVHRVVHCGRPGRAASSLWDSLCAQYPMLKELKADGVHTVDLQGDVTLRWSARLMEDALACEVIDLAQQEWWEAFVVPVRDGSLRTGWKRRWSDSGAPDVWESAVLQLELKELVSTQSDPDFIGLVCAMAASATPTIDSTDAQARRALAAEVVHWREVGARQAAALRSLRHAVGRPAEQAQVAGRESETGAPTKLRLEDIQQWADDNVDRIVILPRAIAEAKRGLYEDPERMYAVLEMLAETYRLVKQSEMDRAKLKQHADQLGVFLGGSVDAGRAGAFGDDYFVNYGGRRRFLDQHVGHGSSRESRFSLRVYYTWCEDTKRVVVGWLPTHLSNSKT